VEGKLLEVEVFCHQVILIYLFMIFSHEVLQTFPHTLFDELLLLLLVHHLDQVLLQNGHEWMQVQGVVQDHSQLTQGDLRIYDVVVVF
jgi:hypothetical protein